MKQKAINLDKAKMTSLFPSLASAINTARYRAKVNVFASDVDPITDEQYITLSQKNWRLNGLLPGDLKVRPGDVALCQILGDDAPASARVPVGVVLAVVRAGEPGYDWLSAQCPSGGFTNIDDGALLAEEWPTNSPVWQLVEFLTRGLSDLVSDLVENTESAAVSMLGLRSIDQTGSTREAVERFARYRSAVGLGGETLVDAWLERACEAGVILSYEWVSDSNATAPLDFRARESTRTLSIEVKATQGRHAKPFMISIAELREAQTVSDYEIWRISRLRVKEELVVGDLRRAAPGSLIDNTLTWLATAPSGVAVTTVQLGPDALSWSEAEPTSCPPARVPSDTWLEDIELWAG